MQTLTEKDIEIILTNKLTLKIKKGSKTMITLWIASAITATVATAYITKKKIDKKKDKK